MTSPQTALTITVDDISEPDFDVADALARLDDDREMLVELIDTLRAETPSLVEQIRAAVQHQDARSLSMAAHSLKGALSVLSANKATSAASALELIGRSGSAIDTGGLVAELEDALARADRAFAIFCSEVQTELTCR